MLAEQLEQTRVADTMHEGVLACPPETPLRTVARMMAHHRVHSLVVLGDPKRYQDERLWGIVSDLDLVRALGPDIATRTAGDIARSPLVTTGPDEPVGHAVELMAEHGVSHVVVVDPASRQPVGILSTLDVAQLVGLGAQLARPR